MSDVSDLRWSIVPKSDQLNAEQLLAGDMTITVTDVAIGSDDQPIVIRYAGDDGRPYKPCKTMRKALVYAWGIDGRQWVGRSMVLFNDPKVRFGGIDVGGIRISQLSDITRDLALSLTATKGKKAVHTIRPLKTAPKTAAPALADVLTLIADAQTQIDMQTAAAVAGKLTSDIDRSKARAAYAARLKAMQSAPKTQPVKTPDDYISALDEAADADAAGAVMAEAEGVLSGDDLFNLRQAYRMAWDRA